MKQVVIFGTGILADLVYFYLMHDSNYEVVAFTVDSEYLASDTFRNLPVVPFTEVDILYPPNLYDMFVAIGYSKLNNNRKSKYIEAKMKGYHLISYISSKSAIWPDFQIGENCIVMEGNIIQPFASIGDNVIVWSGNLIGHNVCVNSHCFIASHAVIAGGVHIKENCFIGLNSIIKEYVTVEEGCIIGAGALITKNTDKNCAYIVKKTNACDISGDIVQHLL